ncbi:hypothetical protein DRN98_02445, partial [Methanosarcinales archaeon]
YYDAENERIREEREKRLREYLRSGGNQLKLDEMNGLEYAAYRDVEKKILENNIFGVDLDRQAAEIASVNLMLKALKPKEKLPLILDENIRVGNSLISGSEEELREYFGESWEDKKPFNWKEAFGEEGFDVVVGNPPWVSFGLRGVGKIERSMDKYFRENYPNSAEYKLSTYAIFMNRAITFLKDGGIFGFIVPDSFLLGRYFSKIRRFILDTAKIREIVLFLEDFWPHGTVGRSVIIILEKEKDEASRLKNKVAVKLSPRLEDIFKGDVKTYSYEQRYFESVLHNRFRLFFDEESKSFVERIEEKGIGLNEIASIYTGVRSKVGQKNIISKEKKGERWYPGLISGSEIGRYWLGYTGYFLHIEPSILWSGGWDPEVVLKEKLLMRQTGDSIVATYDPDKYYHLNNLHSLILENEGYDLKYILAILNSRLMNHYYHLISLELGRTMAQTDIETIEQLPIYPATPSQQKPIIELADRMLALNKELNTINTDFDRYVSLYPRVKDSTLKDYIKDLPVSDKEVLKDHYGNPINQIKGKIKAFEIIEEGEWLVFKVGYIFKTTKGKEVLIENVRVFRCRIEDVNLRKFLYYSIKEYVKPGKIGKGNIYERILKIKVPRFAEREEENRKVIDEIMEVYLDEVERRVELEREIEATDEEIDRMVYELYGLSEEEIRIVEGSK